MSLEALKIKINEGIISPELRAFLFVAIMPINVIVKTIIQHEKMIKRYVKELHYLKSLKLKSKYHISRIEKIESVLKTK